MISKLTLKNFRCFQDFTLDGIRPVTLIAGTNNVGKSTLLESIVLFVDRYSSDVFIKLNNFRGIQLLKFSPQMVWEPLFSNMNTANAISICVNNDKEIQTAVFRKNPSFSSSSTPESPFSQGVQGTGIQLINSYPLELEYKDSTQSDKATFEISENRIVCVTANTPKVTPYAHYYSSKVILAPTEAAELFGKIEVAGNKSKCVEVMKLLDSRIKDLSVIVIGGIGVIFADMGLDSKLPVNILGDGINKLMSIMLLMLANPQSIILIDEIENGFHYSFFPKLWEIIGKLASETKCQVFATTHSYECIDGASVLVDDADNPEIFRYVRLDRNDGIIVPNVFDKDSYEYAVENEWEVR